MDREALDTIRSLLEGGDTASAVASFAFGIRAAAVDGNLLRVLARLFAFDGNSAAANLVQEARNGKGRSWIFIYPNSPMLKAKAASLEGYVTKNSTGKEAVKKILTLQHNIGTKR